MKTAEAKTPAEIGLSIKVISGPRGEVRPEHDTETGKPLPGWPCIGYTVELIDNRKRVIWSGPYFLGVGHVKPLSYDDLAKHRFHPALRMTANEENLSHHWKRGANFKKTPENAALQAATAAKLAKFQKVTPKLEDVCHSLLMDGAAFFDGQRFEDWAGDLGYSSDSIRARETFEACDRTGRDLARALSRDDLAGLREWASNY